MESFFKILPFIPLLLFWKRSKSLQWLLMIVLIFFAGFRAISVGTDTLNYFIYFDSLKRGIDFDVRYEPLYQLINILPAKLGFNFEVVTLLASLLTIVPLYKAFNKDSVFPLFSWFVYLAFCYYFQSFNIMRQGIAASWVLLGYCYFYGDKGPFTKENRKALIYVLIAVLFHYTAILAVFVFAIYYVTVRYNKWYIIQGLSLFVGVFLSRLLFNLALSFLPTYSRFDLKDDTVGSLVNLFVLNIAFIVVNSMIKVRDKWFSLFFSYIVLTNLVLQLPFASRPMMYVGIALSIFFPNFLYNNNLGVKFRPLIWIGLVLYSLFRFVRLFGGGEIFPYENILYTF